MSCLELIYLITLPDIGILSIRIRKLKTCQMSVFHLAQLVSGIGVPLTRLSDI